MEDKTMGRKRKVDEVSMTVVDAISSAQSDLQELFDECDNWKSGMEGTGLENSNKYSMLDDVCSTLESAISELDSIDTSTVSGLDELTFKCILRYKRQKSRADRTSDIVSYLECAVGKIEDRVSELEDLPETDEMEEQINNLNEIKDYIESATSDLESADYPGMYS